MDENKSRRRRKERKFAGLDIFPLSRGTLYREKIKGKKMERKKKREGEELEVKKKKRKENVRKRTAFIF